MGEGEMVCRFCNLRKQDAAFELAFAGSFDDNVRILGSAGLRCLDSQDGCRDLGCMFANGNVDPFAAAR